jgi:hypothetical protein
MIAAYILDIIATEDKVSLQDLQKNANFRYDVLLKLLDHEFVVASGKDEYTFSLNFIRLWWQNKMDV